MDVIARWEPDIAIASGPPLYLNRISTEERKDAREYAIELAGSIGLLILDHHLLRSVEGFLWLEKVSAEAGGNIISAADFMSRRTGILEAKREEMYEKIPVPEGWHEAYAGGKTDYFDYVDSGLSGDLQEIRSYETIAIRKFLSYEPPLCSQPVPPFSVIWYMIRLPCFSPFMNSAVFSIAR